MATAILSNNTVCIVNKDRVYYTFPLYKFTDIEIAAIKAKRCCPGCKTMPLNGLDDKKHLWCDLSRKIAVLEENYR